MSDRSSRPSGGMGSILFAVGAVALAVICCAGPALMAGGILALVGGMLGNPAVLAAGALILAGAVAYVVSRRRAHVRTTERAARRDGSAGGSSPAAGIEAPPVSECCAPRATARATEPLSRPASSAHERKN